jgi:hypothetical protein
MVRRAEPLYLSVAGPLRLFQNINDFAEEVTPGNRLSLHGKETEVQ